MEEYTRHSILEATGNSKTIFPLLSSTKLQWIILFPSIMSMEERRITTAWAARHVLQAQTASLMPTGFSRWAVTDTKHRLTLKTQTLSIRSINMVGCVASIEKVARMQTFIP